VKSSYDANVMVSGAGFDREKTYWAAKLAGELTLGGFSGGDAAARVLDAGREEAGERAVFGFSVDPELFARMEDIANRSQYGILVILLTGFHYLLARYGGAADTIVGMPVFKQKEQKTFVNDRLPIRNRVSMDMTFKDFLARVKQAAAEANEHMNFPVSALLEMLQLPKDSRKFPLFDVLVVLETVHQVENLRWEEFNVVFYFKPANGTIDCEVHYAPGMLPVQTLKRLTGHLAAYFRAVLFQPDIMLRQVDILSEEEKRQVLETFNGAAADYPFYKTLKQLVEEQAGKSPDRTAVACMGRALTYRQLNEQANRVARGLKKKYGLVAGDIAACQFSRSLEMAVGLLAIITLNAVCLPVSPACPQARLQLILNDSRAKVLLGDGDIVLSEDSCCSGAGFSETRTADAPAYVIYTSGSTGGPKGVLLHHRGIVNHLYGIFKEFELSDADVFCHNMDVSYVVSIWLFFGPLVLGAVLHLYPDEVFNNALELFRRAQMDRVTVIEVVPPLLKTYLQLLDTGEPPVSLVYLRALVLTGEGVPPVLVSRFYERYGDRVRLYNAYGQSECSDDTLYYEIPYNPETLTVPIGKPSDNTYIYILDPYMNPQPIGVPGELYITGDCLATGYLNHPELTDDKFCLRRPGGALFEKSAPPGPPCKNFC
jgi:non-ribosomal peptide synthetase component F